MGVGELVNLLTASPWRYVDLMKLPIGPEPLLLDPFNVVPENDVARIHRLSDLLETLPLRSTLR